MRGKVLATGDCLDRSLRRLHRRFEIQNSAFAYPELRCDASACVVPAGALDITVRR
jgi:hypothetical protein